MKFESDQIGSNLMLAITNGLYSRNLSCFREYVQNAYDSPSDAKRVDICEENGINWIIKDNGSGMNEEELKKALGVGIYTKDYTGAEGVFGIGIWSGIAVCDRLIIITKKSEADEKLRIEINAKGIRENSIKNIPIIDFLTDNTGEIEKIATVEPESNESYTMVRLENIVPGVRNLFNEKEIVKYISENLPVAVAQSFQFKNQVDEEFEGKSYRTLEIYVNKKPLYRLGKVKEKLLNYYTKEFKVNDLVVATCWFSMNSEGETLKDDRGITVRHNGFVVIGWEALKSYIKGRFNDRFIGEIHVNRDIKEIKPTAARNDFQQNSITDNLYSKINEFLNALQRVNSYATVNIYSPQNKIKKSLSADSRLQDKMKRVREIKEKNFKESLSFLDKDASFTKLKEDLKNGSDSSKEEFKRFETDVEKEKENSDPTYPESKKFISNLTSNGNLKNTLDTISYKKNINQLILDPYNNELKKGITSKTGKEYSSFAKACWEIGKTLTLFKKLEIEERKKEDENVREFFHKSYILFRNIFDHENGTESTEWYNSAKNKEQIKMGISALITLIYNMIGRLELIEDPPN